MAAYETLVRFFQDGGIFMYPIAFIFAIGIAIGLERFIFLGLAKTANKKAFNLYLPLIRDRNVNDLAQSVKNSQSMLSRVFSYGLSMLQHSKRKEDIQTAIEEGLMESIPRLEKRTQYLATFANIATLLGLLGTIVGLIQAFTAVAAADPAEKATMLSQSISIAMNTTAFGLSVAIPLLLLHAFLQSKTNEIIDSIEMASVKFLNMLSTSKAS